MLNKSACRQIGNKGSDCLNACYVFNVFNHFNIQYSLFNIHLFDIQY